MGLKHAKVSAKADGADATLVQPSDWNSDHVVDAGGLLITASSSVPSVPASGFMTLFGLSLAGGMLPAYIGASGLSASLQPFLGRRKVAYWSPAGGATSLTGTLFGMLAPNALGTATARSVSAASLFSSMQRLAYVSSATVNNRAASYGASSYLRGNAPLMGGFRAVFRFGASDAASVATASSFNGLSSTSAIGSGGAQPSASVNIVGVGADIGESELSIMHNDGAGTATKIPLGANFPANTLSVDAYELILFCPPNGADIGYLLTRLNTGDTASGTITTDLPVSTQTLMPIFMRGNNSTALAVGVDIMGLYVESDN